MSVRVLPVACETLGVRSMATLVEAGGIRILIDPGVSLGMRFSRLPHPREYRLLREARRRLLEVAERADVIVISHYHYDHYTRLDKVDYVWTWSVPQEGARIYMDKELIAVKHPRSMINVSQRLRSHRLLKALDAAGIRYELADGRSFEVGGVRLSFHGPLYHGEEGTKLGWVLVTAIDADGVRVVHASDVEGPSYEGALRALLELKPDILILSGPPLYLEGAKVRRESIEAGLRGLRELARRIPHLVVDHHLIRDPRWEKILGELRRIAREAGNKVSTLAELAGLRPSPIEYLRAQLYREEEPDEDFKRWLRLPREERYRTPPPV